MGQNKSFICSQVDSLMLEKGATQELSSSQSYKKCNTVPETEVSAKPISCDKEIDRFIKSPTKMLFKIVY